MPRNTQRGNEGIGNLMIIAIVKRNNTPWREEEENRKG